MLTCLIPCIWLCFARIYVPRSTFLDACVFESRFLHAYMFGSMFLHAHVPRSMPYMIYAIFHVLVRSMPCLCA